MKLTEEQDAAIAAVGQHQRIAIEAYAGCGKTTTLRLIAEQYPAKSFAYWAFNRAIADEAKATMPGNVDARTTHSVAAAMVPDWNLLRRPRMPGFKIAKALHVHAETLVVGDRRRRLAGGWLAGLAKICLNSWCNSADAEINGGHVVFPEAVLLDPADEWVDAKAELRRIVVDVARRMWTDITGPAPALKWEHQYYLKLYQLSGATIPGLDVLLVDEAQDVNPVTQAIAEAQAKTGTQLVLVGDRFQSIYGWRGAVNAMERVPVDVRLPLTGSFRFGSNVAELASWLLTDHLGAKLPLRGLNPDPGEIGFIPHPNAILGRTNAAVLTKAIELMDRGVPLRVQGGTAEVISFVKGAMSLMAGRRTEQSELAAFETWAEVQDHVALDPDGGDLALMVQLIERIGAERLMAVLSSSAMDRKDAATVLSTAHKAKGLEWPGVRLLGDFRAPQDLAEELTVGRPATSEDLRLLYVAATRAQMALDATLIPFLDERGHRAKPALCGAPGAGVGA